MEASLDRSIARWRNRAALAACAGLGLRLFAVSAAVLGAVALLLRGGFGFEAREAALVLLPLAAVPFVAWALARRRAPSVAATAAWLDVASGGSGAVVAGFELRDPRWRAQLEAALERAPAPPRPDLARPAQGSLAATAFAAAALLVPLPAPVVGPPLAVQEATLERVEEDLAALQEQVDLEPELAEELRESLKRLQQEGALAEPESAFEALDRAQDRLEQEAFERAEAAQAARDELAQAADEAATNPEAAQERLERTLGELARAGLTKDVQSALEKELGITGASLPPGTELDATKLTALSKELAAKLGDRLGKLGKAGLLDAKALEKLGELAKLDDFQFSDHVCDESCKKKPGGT